jgi:hypothetical protein
MANFLWRLIFEMRQMLSDIHRHNQVDNAPLTETPPPEEKP